MDAIILVGGQGTRLRPLTWTRHKSLVPVANRPAIEHLFGWVERSGIERVLLALGQHNEDLAEAYPEGRYGGLVIEHVIERERLESGGAIRNAVQSAGIDGRFVVLNGDVYVDFAFAEALRAHEEAGARLTLALASVADPSSFGVAVTDENGWITGFVEKPPPGTAPSDLVNAGVWIFEPDLVDEIPPGAVRVEETLFPSLVARGRTVLGYRFDGLWADLGTPERYLALCCALCPDEGGLCEGTHIEPGAVVRHAAIAARSCVGARATVEDSVLWEGVEVGDGARVRDSILADGVRIGAGATISGAVLARGASVAEGITTPAGIVLEPDTHYEGSAE